MSSTATARRLHAARPSSRALLDAAIAAAVAAVSMALLAHNGDTPIRSGTHGLDVTGAVLAGGSAAPLIASRRFPLGAFSVSAVSGILMIGLGYPVYLIFGPAVALYLLVADRKQRKPWTGHGTAVVAGFALAHLGVTAAVQQTSLGAGLLHAGLPWAVAWFAGERTRLRRERLAGLEQRALHAERDAERERLLAVAQERARLARDLHDSAGHAISLIAVRAGAARLRHGRDDDRVLSALQAIEDLARHTAEEIDHIVGTLRDGDHAGEDIATPPGLASLETLIAHHAAAGLKVQLSTTGASRPLSPTADQACYRILQQALTNAAHHGAGDAHVGVSFTGAAVELTITNPVRRDGEPRSGGGHGLIGMRERATLLGGTFDTDRVDGTFLVRARIPDGGHRT